MICFSNVAGHCSQVDGMIGNFELEPAFRFGKEYYEGKYRNLNIKLHKDGNYQIKGSLWKYYHGNNVLPFSFDELKEVITELDSLCFGSYSKAKLIGFEVGVNLKVSNCTTLYLSQISNTLINGRRTALIPVYKRRTLWQLSTQGSCQYFKLYSKTFESKLTTNVLRAEYCYRNINTALKKRIAVSDLLNAKLQEFALDKVYTCIQNLQFKSSISFIGPSRLPIGDLNRLIILNTTSMDTVKALYKRAIPNAIVRSREFAKLKHLQTKHPVSSELSLELNNALDSYLKQLNIDETLTPNKSSNN